MFDSLHTAVSFFDFCTSENIGKMRKLSGGGGGGSVIRVRGSGGQG